MIITSDNVLQDQSKKSKELVHYFLHRESKALICIVSHDGQELQTALALFRILEQKGEEMQDADVVYFSYQDFIELSFDLSLNIMMEKKIFIIVSSISLQEKKFFETHLKKKLVSLILKKAAIVEHLSSFDSTNILKYVNTISKNYFFIKTPISLLQFSEVIVNHYQMSVVGKEGWPGKNKGYFDLTK